ncbi:MAG: hypothetical protein HXY42_01560 [Chloroflexi bacterium]|nr:hypothetical protein [Chloroflexota bacterium]
MTLETVLHLPFSLPRLLRAQANEPEQGYHWVGKTSEPPRTSRLPADQGGQKDGREGGSKYRPLGSITLGEVEQATKLFEHQLIPAHVNWIAKNHFCRLPLKRIRDGRPLVIFGYVTSCFPSDGHIENVEDLELLFPRKGAPPDLIRLHRDDISLYSQRTVQSHYLRVGVKASAAEEAEFAASEEMFHAKGFHLNFDRGYYDLLDMNEQNQSAHPHLYLIGSRWLASVPESMYFEITTRLKEMLGWGKVIFNYHPDWLPKEVHTVNRALGLKYKLTKHYLTEPETPPQTAGIIAVEFEERLKQGFG